MWMTRRDKNVIKNNGAILEMMKVVLKWLNMIILLLPDFKHIPFFSTLCTLFGQKHIDRKANEPIGLNLQSTL